MAKTLLRHFVHSVLSILALLILVFVLVRMSGDPAYSLISPDAPPELRQRLRAEFGLDEPVVTQFVLYAGKLAQLDLGQSFRSREPVFDLIVSRMPATITMAGAATLLIIAVGIPLGVYSAYWRGGWVDRVARVVAAVGQSMPSFWLGYMLILVFAVHFRLLPSGGTGGLPNLILPTITLAFGGIAGLTRLLRSGMVESLGSDYVLFHRAKGLVERSILWKHALRNASLTTLSFLGVLVAGLLTGSVLVETVFVWPGIGRLMIEGVEYRDFPVVQGTMLMFAVVYVGTNLIVDVLYTLLNPRLRS